MEGWKKHFWEREYFYDKDMVRDSHVSVAGNCFDQLAAIILKNTTDWVADYDYIGLEDISIHNSDKWTDSDHDFPSRRSY
jgi:hypothetical protein